MLPKTCQKNICVECGLVYFHMLARCFLKSFVLDSHRMSRICQQTLWWVKPVGDDNFSKGEKAKKSRKCLRNEALFLRRLTRHKINEPRGICYGQMSSGKYLRGYNKKPINNSPEMKASTVSPILYLRESPNHQRAWFVQVVFRVYFL